MSNGIKAWSYSAYSLYDQCPFKFKCEKIDKLPQPDNKHFIKGRKWHKLAEDFTVGKLEVLPNELKHFDEQFHQLRKLDPFVEQKWGFRRNWSITRFNDWKGCWLRGVCDVGVVYPDNTATVVDHKTGRYWETNEDQVELFGLLTLLHFPKLSEVETRLWYLESGDEIMAGTFTAGDKEKLKAKWEKKVEPMFNDMIFAPKPNKFCSNCHFRKSNGGPCRHS